MAMTYEHDFIPADTIPRARVPLLQHVVDTYASETSKTAGVWSELASGSAIDVFRRELQNDYLALIDRKLNPPPAPQGGGGGGGGGFGGTPPAPLSEDAKSHLRGQLVSLRTQIQAALPRSGDRATQLHLQGALARIERILDPR